jgi:transglutaminase-like putative cysteine protease
MLLQVAHTTRYEYETPVSYCLNEVRLTPRFMPGQEIRQTDIVVEPAPAFLSSRKDYFGNDVTSFGVLEEHDRFSVTAKSVVDLRPDPITASAISWEDTRRMLTERPDAACLVASEFLYGSPHVALSADLAAYAMKTFTPQRPLLDAIKELSHRINKEFKYEPDSTSIDTPLSEALRRRRGVCQDFAHIMIGALRSIGLAARYVSGYVRSGGKYQGAQASHAWVAAFVPGMGWISFDPTNDAMPSDSHVTLAFGRDYGDVPPVKGVTLGGGKQSVSVEVYVKPAEEERSLE